MLGLLRRLYSRKRDDTHFSASENAEEEAASTPFADQEQRDEEAFKAFTADDNRWEKMLEDGIYPFDDDAYSPQFDRRDFVGLRLSGRHFYGSARNSKFYDCLFENCDFDNAHLEGCSFERIIATDTAFTSASLTGAKAKGCSLQGCNFEDILWDDGDIRDVDFGYSVFHEAMFDGTVFHGVSFYKARGRWLSFDDARMFEMRWRGASFADSSFKRIDHPRQPMYMGETSFTELPDDEEDSVDAPILAGADLSESTFEASDLPYIDFGETDFRATAFSHCNLVGTNFRRSTGVWAGAFRGADLTGSQLPASISFEPVLRKIEASVSLARPAYIINIVTCTSLILAISSPISSQYINLPLFSIPISRHLFAIFGIVQSFLISLYVTIYMIRIWEGLAELPSILPNGLSAPEAISPWTALAPSWLHLRVIRRHKRLRPPRGYFLALIPLTHVRSSAIRLA